MLNTKDKIKSIDELSAIVTDLRKNNKKIVHCHGCFDLLHIGHIRHFEQAKKMGDILIVTVSPDKFIDKGSHRPAFTEELRVEAIASLSWIDYAAINEWPTAEKTIEILKPDIFVKGSEFKDIDSDPTNKIQQEARAIEKTGGQIAFTDDIIFSSTNLINQYLSNFTEETQEYLALMRKRHSLEEILDVLQQMSSLKVLVIGDTIIDDYHYCEAIGKSSKEPTLALKYLSSDKFAGGIIAIANHVANFSSSVHLTTVLGEVDSHEDFIRGKTNKKITPFFVTQPKTPTLIKRRFVDGYSLNKMLEIYIMGDTNLSNNTNDTMCCWLVDNIENFDLVIVADYGHGAISSQMVDILSDKAAFLAVNTQANAGNRGFHTISRYPRADYVCLAEPEIRLETKSVTGDLGPMMDDVADKLQCRKTVVTRGKKGCLIRDAEGGFYEAPAFAYKVVDRVGAGDAFFSVTALAAFLGVSNEILGFIGNTVGSLAVEIIGNERAIDSISLQKYITSLFK